jgi:hypothetical protein
MVFKVLGLSTGEGYVKEIHCLCTFFSWQLTLYSTSCKVARLRLSLYADNPTKQDVDNTVAIMTRFGKATGLCMNMNKSAVLPIRCGQLNIEEVLQNFAGERTSFPMDYMGLPVTIACL